MRLLKDLVSVIKKPDVEFLCLPEDYGIIPEPFPARKLMPEWFKSLPPHAEKKEKLNNSTIKRCAPFLDAMSVGWIIPLVADVEIITNDDASGIETKSLFSRTMIESHSHVQLNSPDGPKHPTHPKPPMKFINHWAIKIPAGYSALFTPPLNRRDHRFECMSGLVDDTYMGNGALEYINFPFIFTEKNYTGILRAGTPLVQMILIKRDNVLSSSRKSKTNKLNKKDIAMIEKTRARRRSHESLYRDELWKRK